MGEQSGLECLWIYSETMGSRTESPRKSETAKRMKEKNLVVGEGTYKRFLKALEFVVGSVFYHGWVFICFVLFGHQ